MPRNKSPKQREQSANRKRKIAVALGLSMLFYLVLNFFLGDMGLFRYMKLRHQREALVAEINSLKASNDELRLRVEELKTDPESIEQLAREQGLVKEGETVYQYEDK